MKQISETMSIHGLIDLSLNRSVESMNRNMVVHCLYCNNELSDLNWYRRHQKYGINYCIHCINKEPKLKRYKEGKISKDFLNGKKDNKMKPSDHRWLRIKHILYNDYNDVEHIKGSIFICDNDNIQVSSSSKVTKKNQHITWVFKCDRINMDYYIFSAYKGSIDNSELEHVWKIPSTVVSHLNNLTISNEHIEDWACYDIINNKTDKVIDNSYVARDNLEIGKQVLSQYLGPLSPIKVKSRLNLMADGCNFHIAATNGRIRNNNKVWIFSTAYKQTDYFLCLAFNDKESSKLEHIWIIPSTVMKGNKITISESQIDKWNKYDVIEI